jgi:hypothetical protein
MLEVSCFAWSQEVAAAATVTPAKMACRSDFEIFMVKLNFMWFNKFNAGGDHREDVVFVSKRWAHMQFAFPRMDAVLNPFTHQP